MSESVFAKAIRDFFSGKFLFLSLAPFVVPFIVLGGLLIYGSGELLGLLHQGASSGDFSFIDESAYPTLSYLLTFSIVHWLITALFLVAGTLGLVLVSLIIAVITVGFLTPYIVKSIRKSSYPHIKEGVEDKLLASLWNIFKIFMKFLLLFVCVLPFLFLPFINFMIFQVPFFYLFYKLMVYDLISVGISADAKKIVEENRVYLVVILLIFFFLSLIPLFGLLMQVFFVVYLSHFILSKSKIYVEKSNLAIQK